MIIVRTPLRVSFFGGGTDHPTWYKSGEKGGVLSTTIDKYIYITLRRLPKIFDFNYRVAWRIIEETKTSSEIKHPIVRAVLENYGSQDNSGYEVLYNADLPAQSGLGSSSAFTVSMLKAYMSNLHQLKSKRFYAEEAIRIEQELLNEPVGSQDQIAAAFGGLNRIEFSADGNFSVEPMLVSNARKNALSSKLLMFFTGFTRSASNIEVDKVKAFSQNSNQLRTIYEMVNEGASIIQSESSDLNDFGKLLHEGWMHKKSLAKSVSNSELDEAYEAAIKAGAVGGKLLGAGGGGFLLFYVDEEKQEAVKKALAPMICMSFGFESEGASVVLFNPDLTSNYE